MLATLQRQGIASELSSSAGHFVCNHVFYALMHLLATRRGLGKVRGGFIHVPYLPEQAAATGVASMLQETINHGLSQALRAALARRSDASQHTTA
jgi:pyroglutamyl-peptidase